MAREPEGDIAWGHFLRQHHGSPQAEGFARSFYGPMTTLATALDALTTALRLDDATGARLDLIGSIVGASRHIPQGITLGFFGFITQPSGRGFGIARMRHEGDPLFEAWTAPDVEYRSLIRAKIGLNNGHGTAAEIEAAAKAAFNAPVVSARDAGSAHIELWVGRIPGPDEGLGRVVPDYLPRAAGVSISIVFYAASLVFGFKNNRHWGFGVGIMARTPGT
jgi:hypothetical protein